MINSRLNLFSIEYFPYNESVGISLFEIDTLENTRALFALCYHQGTIEFDLCFMRVL